MPQYNPNEHWCVQEYKDGEWHVFMFDTGQREAWAIYQALTGRAELEGIPFRVVRPDGVIDTMNIEAAQVTTDKDRLRV
jgi:hypothetical protein